MCGYEGDDSHRMFPSLIQCFLCSPVRCQFNLKKKPRGFISCVLQSHIMTVHDKQPSLIQQELRAAAGDTHRPAHSKVTSQHRRRYVGPSGSIGPDAGTRSGDNTHSNLHYPGTRRNEPTDKSPAAKPWYFRGRIWLLPWQAIQMFGGNQAASGQTQLSRSALDERVHSDYTVRNGAARGLWSGKTPSQRLGSRLTRSLRRFCVGRWGAGRCTRAQSGKNATWSSLGII